MYRRTYKTGSRPTGLDDIVVLHDFYDASEWLRSCNTILLIWSGKIKQMKEMLIWKMWELICQLNVYRRTYKTEYRPTGSDGIVIALDGYDAS